MGHPLIRYRDEVRGFTFDLHSVIGQHLRHLGSVLTGDFFAV